MWNKTQGFSLIEVLVAISLLALILTFIFREFINFSSNSQKSENILYLSRELNILKKLLEEDLRSVVFLPSYTNDFEITSIRNVSGIQGDNKVIGPHNTDQIFMHLHKPAISFNEILSSEDPRLHEVGYFIALNDTDAYDLYRVEQYYIDNKFNSYIGLISKDNIAKAANAKNSLVTSNILDFNLSYLSHNFIWLDSWNSISNQNQRNIKTNRSRIPQAVKIELTLQRNNEVLKDEFQINLRPNLGENIYWGNF